MKITPPLVLEELNMLERELSMFNANDLLVHFSPKNSIPFEAGEIPISPALETLLKQANKKEQQQGYASLSVAEGWIKSQEGNYIPLFIHTINPQYNGVRNTLKWNLSEDEWMLNPHTQGLMHLSSKSLETDKELIVKELSDIGFEVNDHERYVGFFHPFRYALLRDAVELKTKDDLHRLDYFFDGSQQIDDSSDNKVLPLLFPSDQSQFDAITLGRKSGLVIQGPPGTGKSQVLANLLGLLIQDEQHVLVCSSKKEALEVLYQRFKVHDLEDFIFLRNGEHSAKSLLSSLKQSWNLLEQYSPKHARDESLALVNQFNQDLILYHTPGTIGTLSPKAFLRETKLDPLQKTRYQAGLPSYASWKKDLDILQKIPNDLIQYLSQISPTWTLQNEFEDLLVIWRHTIEELSKLPLEENSLEKISEYYRICQAAHLFSGENYARFYPLLKRKKHLFQLKRDFEKLRTQKEQLQDKIASWRTLPTFEELQILKENWSKERFWNRKKIQRQKILWLRIEGLNWQELIHTTLEFYKLKSLEIRLQEKLDSIGFHEPSKDFTAFFGFIQTQNSPLYPLYQSLSPEQVQINNEHFFRVSKILSTLNRTFQSSNERNMMELMLGLTARASALVPYLKLWDNVQVETKKALRNVANIGALNKAVIETAWNRFLSQNPSMNSFIESSEEYLDFLSKSMEISAEGFASLLHGKRKEQFDAFHELLALPNRRLTEKQLHLKETLKAGKRELVKWFARKRNLPTVREVLSSSASIWVKVLKPLWFTNPVQLTLDFELSPSLFDVGLVDEASQMPLSHALGTLYRSGRIIVVGDLMQMAPTSYFSSGSNERMNLLEHAAYNLPTKRLKFHYRSRNASLIEFSNAQFYQNELVVVPCFPPYKAIEDHLIQAGLYREGINQQEIETLVEILLKCLSSKSQTVGVVTFSERQLGALCETLRHNNEAIVWQALANGKLVLKTLEQVQGDEYDELIISLGYGKNEDGKVDLRMGPLTQFGGEKRLNVLFTRARKKLHVIRSLGSADFGIVNSQGLQILKKWLQWLENLELEHYGGCWNDANLEVNGQVITLERVSDLEKTYLNLQSYRSLLRDRGWTLKEKGFSSEPDRARILPLDDIERFA